MKQTLLNGITWNHSRGYTPLVSTAQRYEELHPEVEIRWSKRSLQAFADESLAELAEKYDLLVIDHPWVGYAAAHKTLAPLDRFLEKEFLRDLKKNSVGASYESYRYEEHLWAAPIDAAAPVASCRPDLFDKSGERIPENFQKLLNLASKGRVLVPGIAIDSLMNFYMFCVSSGMSPFESKKEVVSDFVGIRALQLQKKLMDRVNPECFDLNPIKVYERMSRSEDYFYCPFGYGYTNYAKEGYSKYRLQFLDVISLNGNKMTSTLGGTGLAISSSSRNIEIAADYLKYVSSSDCQETLYFDSGGQPAHYQAWINKAIDCRSNSFFSNTLPTLERAYLRPRYAGYLTFQDEAGEIVRAYLKQGGKEQLVLKKLNELYKYTLK